MTEVSLELITVSDPRNDIPWNRRERAPTNMHAHCVISYFASFILDFLPLLLN